MGYKDHDEIGDVYYDKTGIQFYHILKKNKASNSSADLTKLNDLRTYLNIKFLQTMQVWSNEDADYIE